MSCSPAGRRSPARRARSCTSICKASRPGRTASPDAAWQLITACMEKDPARRPSAAELESALRGAPQATTTTSGWRAVQLPPAGDPTERRPAVPSGTTWGMAAAPPVTRRPRGRRPSRSQPARLQGQAGRLAGRWPSRGRRGGRSQPAFQPPLFLTTQGSPAARAAPPGAVGLRGREACSRSSS